jgi:hypothetical protein
LIRPEGRKLKLIADVESSVGSNPKSKSSTSFILL